jgi:hypothetical protein
MGSQDGREFVRLLGGKGHYNRLGLLPFARECARIRLSESSSKLGPTLSSWP